ncbi:MAG: hypothetical protein Q7V57_02830 [Actinomycetota bacterium]|nr:hypothetical protein [Actinomycetota bacterium]
MSDFGSDPTIPAPPTAPLAPPPPPFGAVAAPGYVPYQMAPAQKPPRPVVFWGSLTLIAGAVVMIIGSALNWYTINGVDLNGFKDTLDPDTGALTTNTGGVFVMFAVASIGFGIAQLAARRVLSVAIIAVVLGSFTVLMALAELGMTSDRKDYVEPFNTFSMGAGIYVVLAGSLVSLAGAIATLARRRRWPAQG